MIWLAALAVLLAAPALGQAPEGLCAGQPECRIVRTLQVGSDRGARRLSVVEVAIGEDLRNEAARARAATRPRYEVCDPYRRQFWLLVAGQRPTLVLDLCNDGYGAAGVGEDSVAVRANTLIHTQSGGSAWRWSVERTIQLAPLQVQSERHEGWWTLGPNTQRLAWDWRGFSGRAEWWAPACGQPPDENEGPRRQGRLPYRYSPIPQIDTEPRDLAGAELGSCALQLDASGRNGFIVNGAPSAEAARREFMRVLLVGEAGQRRTLIVTVGKARWTTGAANWIHDDHLELWLGPPSSYATHCTGRAGEAPRQWGIRIADGAVFAGFGAPRDAPEVLRRREATDRDGTTTTFHLRLPEENAEAISVALARGDGRRQGRMIATSPVRLGVLRTLGDTFYVPHQAVQCAVSGGRLDLLETGRPRMLERSDR
jgi:hypothetical protein